MFLWGVLHTCGEWLIRLIRVKKYVAFGWIAHGVDDFCVETEYQYQIFGRPMEVRAVGGDSSIQDQREAILKHTHECMEDRGVLSLANKELSFIIFAIMYGSLPEGTNRHQPVNFRPLDQEVTSLVHTTYEKY